MVFRVICIDYRELVAERSGNSVVPSSLDLPWLRDCTAAAPQDDEEKIARYLEMSPAVSAMGKGVGDALDRTSDVVLFPGQNTDGVFVWPTELSYYVRKYHVRVPKCLVD